MYCIELHHPPNGTKEISKVIGKCCTSLGRNKLLNQNKIAKWCKMFLHWRCPWCQTESVWDEWQSDHIWSRSIAPPCNGNQSKIEYRVIYSQLWSALVSSQSLNTAYFNLLWLFIMMLETIWLRDISWQTGWSVLSTVNARYFHIRGTKQQAIQK